MTDEQSRAFANGDEAFAALFRTARERLARTQEEVAREMVRRGFDFHQQTIYKIERGLRKVTVGESVALAEIVETPVEALTQRYPDSPEALEGELNRTGHEYAEMLYDLARHVAEVRSQRALFVQMLAEYDRAPFTFLAVAGQKVPMSRVFEVFAQFPGLGDFTVAWRELVADDSAVASFQIFGYPPESIKDVL